MGKAVMVLALLTMGLAPHHVCAQQPETQCDSYTLEICQDADSVILEVRRSIQMNRLPFSVRYDVKSEANLAGIQFAWDRDKYVDSDADGEPGRDFDESGPSLALQYTENFNPTVILQILDAEGELLATWENMARNDFMTSALIELDGEALLHMMGGDTAGADVCWAQAHMPQTGFEYLSLIHI